MEILIIEYFVVLALASIHQPHLPLNWGENSIFHNECFNHWMAKKLSWGMYAMILGYETADTFVITILHHLNIPTRNPDFAKLPFLLV